MNGSTNQSQDQRTDGTLRPHSTTRRTSRSITSTLRAKVLLAFLVVALFPLVVLALLNHRTTRQALTNSANQALFAAASQTAAQLDAFISAELGVISTEAQLPMLAEYLNLPPNQREDSQVKAQVLDILRTFTQKDAVFISSYGLLDLKGRNVIDTDTLSIGGDESTRDYFRAALETGLAYVSPVEFAAGDGKANLYFSRVIYTVAGQPVGVLRVRYSAAILQQFALQDIGLIGPHSYPILLDENGIFLADGLSSLGSPSSLLYIPAVSLDPAHTAELEADWRLPPQPGDTLLAQMPGLADGLARVDSSEPYFTVRRTAADIGSQAAVVTRMKTRPWLVVFLEPQETFLAPVRAQTRDTVALAVIIVILVASAAIGAAQLLTNPIIRLTAAARQVAEGNLDAQARVESNDEIGVLAKAFNLMTSQLAETLEELRTSEVNYRTLAEASHDIVFIIDSTLRVAYVNSIAAKYLEKKPEEIIGLPLVDLFPAAIAEKNNKFLGQLFESATPIYWEAPTWFPQGEMWLGTWLIPLKDDTEIVTQVMGVARDITERKHTEEALTAHEREFRTLAENSPDNIARFDTNGRTVYVNPTLEKTLGLPATEMLGNTPTESAGTDDLGKYQEKVFEVLETGKEAEIDLVVQDRGEGVGHYNVRFVAERGADGAITGVLAIGRDMTRYKRAEAEIRRLNQELEQRVFDRTAQLEAANKELEAFAYSVSHDLRAPLRHIDGFLELLQQSIAESLDERSQHYMDTIADAVRRMGLLIDDLLSFSRMGRHELSTQPVDLARLVREVIRELAPEAAGRAINWRIADLPLVTGDRAMLRIVFINLIANAVKFTRSRDRAEIEIGCQSTQDTDVVIFVRDNGVGFDPQYADKLFGVFQRLHRAEDFEGTGIGLANVRRVIARHGGRVWAEGEIDHGATFYFALPQSIQGG